MKKGERKWQKKNTFELWVLSYTSSDGLFRTIQANATYIVVVQYWWMELRGLWQNSQSLAIQQKVLINQQKYKKCFIWMYASDIGRIDGGHCDISGVLLIYHHMNSRGTKVKELQLISILSAKG